MCAASPAGTPQGWPPMLAGAVYNSHRQFGHGALHLRLSWYRCFSRLLRECQAQLLAPPLHQNPPSAPAKLLTPAPATTAYQQVFSE